MSLAIATESAPLSVAVIAEDAVAGRRIASLVEGAEMRVAQPGDADLLVLVCRTLRTREANQIRALKRQHPDASILVMAASVDMARTRFVLEAGARGLLLESDAEHALGPALQVLAAGQLSLPSAFGTYDAKPTLTTREKQILALVVLGFSNGEISRKLYLAESTVKSHLSSAFTKLGVRSRNQATARILDPASGLGPGILHISEEGARMAGLGMR
jgi:DNA-binding NarL/FixJ family response regulator